MRGYLGRYGSDIGIVDGSADAPTVRPGPEATNPSYLAAGPDGAVVYAALEAEGGGAVGAFAVDGAELRPLGSQPTGGVGTCYVSVDVSGSYLLSADYVSGTLAVHPIRADGSLGERSDLVHHTGSGPDPDRQAGPHAHQVLNDPTGLYVLAVDLGTDTICRYTLDDGRLRPFGEAAAPPGSGPRHLAFHPGGRYAYVAGELDSTVTVLDLETFDRLGTVSTQPADDPPSSSPSAIRVSSDGRYCYVANRGPDEIAVLAVSPDGADLRLVTAVPSGGAHPRDLVLAGERMYAANQHSDLVSPFRVGLDGVPEPDGVPLSTPAPACVLLL